jgi:hypothetical protein
MSQQNTHGNIPTHQFGRLFPNLPPLNASPADLRILVNLMRDANLRLPAADNNLYSGLTYLGQFIDHDLTREKTTQLNNPGIVDVDTLNNVRTSWFDLDSCFGENNEFLNQNGKFDIIVNVNGEEDLPRKPDGTANIGDPRNEENLIISNLHLLFLKFYNKIFDDVKFNNQHMLLPQLITESKKIFLWHYQYIVITQFLKDITGQYFSRLFDPITDKPVIHQSIVDLGPKIPIEFSGAVYRFGHSLVRDGYYLNEQFDLFPLFDPVIPDLSGFRPLPPNQKIDWSMFFPMPYTKGFQEWEPIDPFIVNSLYQLPIPVATGEPILPLRTLIRGSDIYGFPSGQVLARAMGINENEILTASNGGLVFQSLNGIAPQPELDLLNLKFGESTPLFYYILMESWVFGNSNSLGPLGSAIVGGVMLNLLTINQDSYLNNSFLPVKGLYGCVKNGEYYINDLITYTLDLPKYDETTIIPDIKTNFFDQHKVSQFSVGFGIQHPLQPTVQPDLIQEIAIEPFPGLTINQFDPTLILGLATQEEINLVAQNAIANQIESIYAVVKFIANKNIQGIAQGLIEPFAKKIPRPIVNLPFVLPQEENNSVNITLSQLRGRALTKTINESLRLTQQEALDILSIVELEINNALTSVPPSVNIFDFIFNDIIIV